MGSFSFHGKRKLNTWELTCWDIYSAVMTEMFSFLQEDLFWYLLCYCLFDSRRRGKLISPSSGGKSLPSELIFKKSYYTNPQCFIQQLHLNS